ncbi:MAG TPA: hypothetical protein EYG80_06335 [Flavobacteriaceae bacterium]|nr:hypothetical protein [Flavobacteriaceae bacterium]
MNAIKNFFSWILGWLMFGLILLVLGWAYSTFIDDDKTTKKTAISKDDKLIEIEKTYWDNGNLKSETTYKKSYKAGWKKVKTTLIPHGVAKDYYESGVLKKEDPYVEGNRTGLVQLYLEDGSLEISSEYVNNKREGTTTFYEKDGSVFMTILYKNDVEVVEKKKGLDALYEDMPYAEARKIVLAEGWVADGLDFEELTGQEKTLYIDNGWTEISSCAFSAGSPCRYEFTKNQKKLVLITLGECFNEEGEMCELTMTQWFFE